MSDMAETERGAAPGSCRTCRHWSDRGPDGRPASYDPGYCRRFPPNGREWARTLPEDTCGEFAPAAPRRARAADPACRRFDAEPAELTAEPAEPTIDAKEESAP